MAGQNHVDPSKNASAPLGGGARISLAQRGRAGMQFLGALRRARPMLRIMPVIVTAGIMEDGEMRHHAPAQIRHGLAQPQPVLQYTGPVRGLVKTIPFQLVLLVNKCQKPGIDRKINHDCHF